MIFYWSLRDSESPQVSRTLISIQDDFSSALVWMVSIFPVIFSYPRLLSQPFRAPTTIAITVTFIFHSFFNYLARYKHLLIFLFSFIFTLWVCSTGMAKSTRQEVLFFFFINTRSDLLAWIGGFVSISTSQRILCVLFYMSLFLEQILVCAYFIHQCAQIFHMWTFHLRIIFDGFHWRVKESIFPQYSNTLLQFLFKKSIFFLDIIRGLIMSLCL